MQTIAATRAPENVMRLVCEAKRILAVTHENPDGDAMGSLAAFGAITLKLGIQTRLYCPSAIPRHLAWLAMPHPLLHSLEDKGWMPDLVVFLDCADEDRAGRNAAAYALQARDRGIHTLCIDHHASNRGFADTNWVRPSACATGILVAALARDLGMPLTGELGEAVYLSVTSDTGSFTYGNTTAEALVLAAEIIAAGFSVAEFTQKSENNWSLARMHLWGYLMAEVTLQCQGQLVVSIVPEETLRRFNVPETDLEGYASWLRRLEGVKVALLARPGGKGTKISLRSMGDVDVQAVATQFGGGGHAGAAGLDMPESPESAVEKVRLAIQQALGQ